ncbi:unnamed protein product [Amaranthus hypochondriacus]
MNRTEDEIIYEDEDEDEDEDEEATTYCNEEEQQEYRYIPHEEDDHHDHHLVADILNDGDFLVFHPKSPHNHHDSDHDFEDHDEHDNYSINSNDTQRYHHHTQYIPLIENYNQNPERKERQQPISTNDEQHNNNNNLSEVGSESSNSFKTLFEDSVDEQFGFDHDYNDDKIEQHHDEFIIEDYTSRLDFSSDSDQLTEVDTIKDNKNTNNVHFGHSKQEESMPQECPTNYHGETHQEKKNEVVKEDTNFKRDENFLFYDPPKWEAKKMEELQKEKEVIFEDTYTIGSTSKSSSDWRSSIRDSGTDDPFSSSSRRSCPKWESYAVYQKYDEEIMFLDRISAQKLHETESLKSIQVEPRSMSQRIFHKMGNKKKRSSNDDIYKKNPYNELEVAYVAQVCLAWETLNWNYENFKRKQMLRTQDLNHGCLAHVAQKFQQFQVLLQRYIECEPYEYGKRPQIFTRIRCVAPKLLQVPEYLDYEGEEKEVTSGRIASTMFMKILEDSIQTFMNFLKADRETHCQVISSLFKHHPKGSIDPTLLKVYKKHNKKKKLKLKELQRSRICLRKKKLTKEEEMEILMGLIDLKVVSRVLRMANITQEQLHWCEAKMDKLRILDGKLQRDSSPLFFPPH